MVKLAKLAKMSKKAKIANGQYDQKVQIAKKGENDQNYKIAKTV